MPTKNHVQKNVDLFARARPGYEKFATEICELIGEHCGKELIHTTEARAKTVESFERKCKKVDENGKPRYPFPMKDITDLAGVRIIVFVRDSANLFLRHDTLKVTFCWFEGKKLSRKNRNTRSVFGNRCQQRFACIVDFQ